MSKQIYVNDQRFPAAVVLGSSPRSCEDVIFSQEHRGSRPTPEKLYYMHRRARASMIVGARLGTHYVFSRDIIEDVARESIVSEFKKLRKEWHAERGATSSIVEMAMCRAHLQIIGLGPLVISLILRCMDDEGSEPDMWFVALQMLTRTDPVTDEIRGDFPAMARRWLEWAAANGYAW